MKETYSSHKVENKHWDLTPLLEEKGQRYFSADEVINAYLQGKQDQLRDLKKHLAASFERNLEVAKTESVKLFEELNSSAKVCYRIFLKMKDIERFNAIFLIDDNFWCEEDFDKFYERSLNIKQEVNSDTFDLAIIFMPTSEYLDEDSLRSDGYILTYEE